MDSETFWLPSGSFQPLRYHPGGIGNWSGHLPFAHDLICALEPNLLVELGTHYGESYFGFCQAIAENSIPCSCYAVDTWFGESHAGVYDESVFNEVAAHNSALYSRFSYLLRTTFDSAVSNFTDDSIDILHIDGLHTYEAVSHDFHTWYRKVKPGGLVLLHDVMARHEDFGVWKFWAELKSLGKCFAFTHSWGLGVHCKPGPSTKGRDMLEVLFDSCSKHKEHIRTFYSLCALKLENQHYYKNSARVPVQVFPYGPDGYSADTVITGDLISEYWQQVAIDLSPGIGNGPLRLDPADRPGLIDIASIVLRNQSGDEIFWHASPSDIALLSTGGTVMRLKGAENAEYCRFLSFGPDPQLFMPSVDEEHTHEPAVLEIRLRIQTGFSSLVSILTEADRCLAATAGMEASLPLQVPAAEHDLVKQERDALMAERDRVHQGRDALLAERDRLNRDLDASLAERARLTQEVDSMVAMVRKKQGDLYIANTDLKRRSTIEQESRSRLDDLNGQLEATQSRLIDSQFKVTELEQVLTNVLTSRSWRITAPIRDLIAVIRPSKR
jgi:hypothetical protein